MSFLTGSFANNIEQWVAFPFNLLIYVIYLFVSPCVPGLPQPVTHG